MLSIEKIDLDSDPILDETMIKLEEIDIVVDPIENQGRINLELAPVVYTTRLDDMTVLKSCPAQIYPREATNQIIKESKPSLYTLPITSNRKRRNKKSFKHLQEILQKIYRSANKMNNTDDTQIMPDESIIEIDLSSVKSEVQDEPNIEKTKSNVTCKYSELLKLCKPCSVMIGPPIDQVIHGGQLLVANKVQNPKLSMLSQGQSTDDEEPLITIPELLVPRNVIYNIPLSLPAKAPKRKSICVEVDKTIQDTYNNIWNKRGVLVEDLDHMTRLMRNGILEVRDKYSKERHIYYTDKESNVLDYVKVAQDSALTYEPTNNQVDCRYIAENCCWVKRDESLKSMYPKVLIYANSRFIRRPHPCKPGACLCCCRKTYNKKKPSLHVASDLNDDDKEIKDLEDEIDKSIISINRPPKLESNEWLRDLLTKRGTDKKHRTETLIGKALSYKTPQPKKIAENRRLVTVQKGESQNAVIILRNFSMDVTEIYVINMDGGIETYIKTNCYNNTSQPDVRKLLKKPSAINELVCCWFKREEVITKLHNAQDLHPSAVKFIRTNHICPSNECTCCCKPKKERSNKQTNKEVTLTDINLRKSWRSAFQSLRPLCGVESQSGEQSKLVPPKTYSVKVKLQQNEPPPLVSILSPKPSTSQNDEDCVITSVTTNPMLQTILQQPTPPIPVPTAAVPEINVAPQGLIVTDVINSDELSQEVNSLITSILERFKDVRLTINDDGKVAAALNTPVHTLSTVELKVLANILSYAQTQVNSLGLKGNSGMSLSNIINLKVDDQAKSALDPQSVYKAFGKNVNLNTNAQNGAIQHTNMNNTPFASSQVPVSAFIPQTYNYFTNTMSVKNQHFNDAFSSFITTQINQNSPAESFAPVIENVFTLKEETETEPSSTTVWYRKPGAQEANVSNSPKSTINKRKDTETQMTEPKKLRVVSPTKLGAATNNLEGTVTKAALINQNLPVVNLEPRDGVASNKVPSLVNSQMQSIVKGAIPTSTLPILIINPLNTPGLNTGGVISVPFTNNIINTGNEFNVTNPEMPIIVSTSSTSDLVTSEGPGISTVQDVNAFQNSVEVSNTENSNPDEEFGADVNDMDYSVENDEEADYDEDNGSEMGKEAEGDCNIENEPEEKHNPDNEEEEDCILGF